MCSNARQRTTCIQPGAGLRQIVPSSRSEQLEPAEGEIRRRTDADAPHELQPRLRNGVVDADADGYRSQRRRVDAVQVPVAPGRIEERLNVDPAAMDEQVVGDDDTCQRRGDV